jgi:hypothetical protein
MRKETNDFFYLFSHTLHASDERHPDTRQTPVSLISIIMSQQRNIMAPHRIKQEPLQDGYDPRPDATHVPQNRAVKPEPLDSNAYTSALIADDGFDDRTDHEKDPTFINDVYDIKDEPEDDVTIKQEPTAAATGPAAFDFSGGGYDQDELDVLEGGRHNPVDVEEAEKLRTFALPGLFHANVPVRPAQQDADIPKNTGAAENSRETFSTSNTTGVLGMAECSLFIDESETQRIGQPNGKPYGTICFQPPFRDHPHHHKLACGHTVMTSYGPVACGIDCMRDKSGRGMPTAPKFQCPEPGCARKDRPTRNNIFMPKSFFKPSRACERGYIYGEDSQADAQRQAQKVIEALQGISGMGVENESEIWRGRVQPQHQRRNRRRSQSPNPYDSQPYRERDVLTPAKPVDEAEARLVAELKAIEANKPRILGSNAKRELERLATNGTEKFRKGALNLPNRRLDDLRSLEDYEALPRSSRSARPTFDSLPSPAKENPRERPYSYAKGGLLNGKPVASVRNALAEHWTMSEEQADDLEMAEDGVIVEESTPDGRFFEETTDGNSEEEEDPSTVQQDFDVPETHCVCDSPADGAMLECERCHNHFHPSCVGKGSGFYSQKQYDGPNGMRYRRLDAQAVLEHHNAKFLDFTCKSCDDALSVKSNGASVIANIRKATRERAIENKELLAEAERIRRKAEEEALAKQLDNVMPEYRATRTSARHKPIQPFKTEENWKPESIANRIASPNEKIAAAYLMSMADESTAPKISCITCGKKILGVLYRCKSCKEWDICDTCIFEKGIVHTDHHHWFEVVHVDGNIPYTPAPVEQPPTDNAMDGQGETAVEQTPKQKSHPAPVVKMEIDHDKPKEETYKRTNATVTMKKRNNPDIGVLRRGPAPVLPPPDVRMGGTGERRRTRSTAVKGKATGTEDEDVMVD